MRKKMQVTMEIRIKKMSLLVNVKVKEEKGQILKIWGVLTVIRKDIWDAIASKGKKRKNKLFNQQISGENPEADLMTEIAATEMEGAIEVTHETRKETKTIAEV